MKLSPNQVAAFKEIMKWYVSDAKEFALAGYAGTGKTTLAKYIREEIGDGVHFCAYTGKAANVLREKGCKGATTVHGAIYAYDGDEDEDGEVIKQPTFRINYEGPAALSDLLIVDEYSMLSNEVLRDMRTLCRKILFLGDPFQLPPVNGECDIEADLFLTEVHRQALESPIIRAATQVRLMEKALEYCDEPGFAYNSRQNFDPSIYLSADQLIVGYNKTRQGWNKRFREIKGYKGDYPVAGDKLICLKNNKDNGLFNGMIGVAGKNARLKKSQVLEVDFDSDKHWLTEAWDGPFRGEADTADKRYKFLDRFDFAYAITCHKSQGSEFDSVVVYREQIGKEKVDRARWLYTAITRAKNQLYLVDPK